MFDHEVILQCFSWIPETAYCALWSLCNANLLSQYSQTTYCLSSTLANTQHTIDGHFFPFDFLFIFLLLQVFDSANLNTIFFSVLWQNKNRRWKKREASKGKWKNVQIKISHECHTEREIVVQTSFYSLFIFFLTLSLVLHRVCWLAVWFSSTLIFIKRDKKKKYYMQSGTIESMRELNHPRNTKYLWQRVQWIAKVAQMNVLKHIFPLPHLLFPLFTLL